MNLRMFILSGFLLRVSGDETFLQQKYDACNCKNKRPKLHYKFFRGIEGNVYEYQSFSISCCAKEFIGKNGQDFNITWLFRGIKTPYSTLRPISRCFGQKLSTDRIDFEESGNHTCVIQLENGEKFKKLFKLRVSKNPRRGAFPISYNNTGVIYTDINGNVTLKCTFFMQKGARKPDIFWRKYWVNETGYYERIATTLARTQERTSNAREEFVLSELIIKNITQIHFGNYSCNAVTMSAIITQNISILNDVHPDVKSERIWKLTLFLSIIALLSFLGIVFSLFRNRYAVILKWKRFRSKFGVIKNQDEFLHDIFLIYGPTAKSWVFEILLKRLEDEWNYDCFVPERDLLGGEDNIESVCREIMSSYCKIVILTECLFASPWNSHILVQSIHQTVKKSSKIIGIDFIKDFRALELPSSDDFLLEVIKLMKKIPAPEKYLSNASNKLLKYDTNVPVEALQKKNNGKIIERQSDNSEISSRKFENCVQKRSVQNLERQQVQHLYSLSTRSINKETKSERKNGTILKNIFQENLDKVFWQRLRLHVHPINVSYDNKNLEV